MQHEPVHHTIVAMDVAGSGGRDDVLQLRMRRDLRAIVADALAAQGLDPATVHHTDLGDGIRLIVPAGVSPTTLLDPFVSRLAVALRQHRRTASEAAGLRLRVAVHMGLLHRDAGGWAGAPLVACARMLDAAPVRRVMAATDDADLVLVVSEAVYEDVVRHDYGLDPAAFHPVGIVEKETAARVWVHVPGYRVPRGLDSPDRHTDPPLPVAPGGHLSGGAGCRRCAEDARNPVRDNGRRFAGRTDELAALTELLDEAAGTPTILAIAGGAGIGKTALAATWARRVADRFPDGQLSVNLRGCNPILSPVGPAEAVRGFLDALAVPVERIPADLAAQTALYRSLVSGRRMLVVLDNARDAEQVRPLLPGSPTVVVVVTSRDRLTSLTAVEGAHCRTLDRLTVDDARDLLARSLGRHRLTAEPQAVDEIITRCARLPLTLTIVAARAATHPHVPLSAIAEEIGDSRARPAARAGDDPTADVRSVFAWSYRTLSPAAARLFRLLGLHPGPDLAAPAAASLAASTVQDTDAVLTELVRALLLSEPHPGRFALHDLLRAYATELTRTADPEDERRTATHRLLDHYLYSAVNANCRLDTDREVVTPGVPRAGAAPVEFGTADDAMAWFAVERAVLLGAVRQAGSAGFDTHAWQLACAIATFLERERRWSDLAVVHRVAVDAAQRLRDRGAQATVHHRLALSDSRPEPAVGDDPGQPPTAGGSIAGALPAVWNIEAYNPGFTGRDEFLGQIRRHFVAGRAGVQALFGVAGVGKTQLAVEYAHRHAADYDLVWCFSAEHPPLIGDQMIAFGVATGLVAAAADGDTAIRAVHGYLRGRDRWLLVFDDADSPDDVRRWLPGGPGHVLITSRHGRWNQLGALVEVETLRREESMALLVNHRPVLTEADADRLAEALADLPLALAQAAGFLNETGTTAEEYLQLLTGHAGELLDECRPATYRRSFAAAVQVTSARLADVDPAAAVIAQLCAFLAPAPVSASLFAAVPDIVDGPAARFAAPLAAVTGKPVALRRSIARVVDYGLAKADVDGIVMHQLVQAVLRDHLTFTAAAGLRLLVQALLVAAQPGDPGDHHTWPQWARLWPHLLAADPATADDHDFCDLAIDATSYLLQREDFGPYRQLIDQLYRQWLDRFGPDDPRTLRAANGRGSICHSFDRDYAQARSIHEDTLRRRRRIFGDNHRRTFFSATNLGRAFRELGETEQARQLHEGTLARCRTVCGDDDIQTLGVATQLAKDLLVLGKSEQACLLYRDTLARLRRRFGEDHIRTMNVAFKLAQALRVLGDTAQACELTDDTFVRRQRVYGMDHPQTLVAAAQLAADLHTLGQTDRARQLTIDTIPRMRRAIGDTHPETVALTVFLASTEPRPEPAATKSTITLVLAAPRHHPEHAAPIPPARPPRGDLPT